MKSRLYTFDEFLNEAYKIIAESITWDSGVSTFIALGIEGDQQKPLSRLRSMAKSQKDPSRTESEIAEKLDKMGKTLNAPGLCQVTKVSLDLKETSYNQLIGGKAKVKGPISVAGDFVVKGDNNGRYDLTQLLLYRSYQNTYKAVGVRKVDDKKVWKSIDMEQGLLDGKESIEDLNEIDDTTLIAGSGNMFQWMLIGAQTEIAFEKSSSKKVVSPLLDLPAEYTEYQKTLSSGKKASKKDAKITEVAKYTLVLYIIKEILPGEGTEMPYEDLKVEKTIVPKGGGGETIPLSIQDNGILFEQGKSVLREDGKKYISNALASQFVSIEDLEVIGGASQEGKEDFNKKLCLDRAKAVADFLTGLGYTAKASDKTQIQPKESTEDRKTWRKVTLNVKGSARALPSGEETKERVYYADRTYKLDKAVIVQAAYNFEVKIK